MKETTEPLFILLVEDSPGDVELIREGLRKGKVANAIKVVEDGEEAMAYLLREGKYKDQPRPHLVLLDVNIPKKNGHEVLKAIRSNPDIATIPVVMLTTSDLDKDIISSYECHVNAYITKPMDPTEFINVVTTIEHFWLALVTLPPRK